MAKKGNKPGGVFPLCRRHQRIRSAFVLHSVAATGRLSNHAADLRVDIESGGGDVAAALLFRRVSRQAEVGKTTGNHHLTYLRLRQGPTPAPAGWCKRLTGGSCRRNRG